MLNQALDFLAGSFSGRGLPFPSAPALSRVPLELGQSLSSLPELAPFIDGLDLPHSSMLSVGLPFGPTASPPNVASRIFLSPSSLQSCQKRTVLVSSSRIGRDLDSKPRFFDALRTIAIQLKRERKVLLSCSQFTTHRFVSRLSELFELPILFFEPIPNRFRDPPQPSTVYFSEPLVEQTVTAENEKNCRSSTSVDDLVAQIADELIVLGVRRNGNVQRAVRNRLRAGRSVRILISNSLTSKKLQTELLGQGASGWWLFKTRPGSEENPLDPDRHGPGGQSTDLYKSPARILTLDEIDQRQFLIHWTRARHGPTPAQSEMEYLDELLLGQSCPANDPSNSDLLNLSRIIAGQRIAGTGRLSRSRRAVVCLSEIKLSGLAKGATFQSHLARWDRLPYGIAISRTAAQDLGAQPVIYGDDGTWAELNLNQQPFFQSVGGDQSRWMEEREWRIPGDLDLRQLGFDEAVVFVPTRTAADWIAPYSRWPIVVLGVNPKRNRR